MTETAQDRLKRLRIRSWRRGIKEMDLILGGWFDDVSNSLTSAEVSEYDALLSENDHDRYSWVSGQAPPPAKFVRLIDRIARHAMARQPDV